MSEAGANGQRLGRECGRGWAQRVLAFILVALALLSGGLALAQTPSPTGTAFDHATTGYILDGAHLRQRCESCHVQGTFKGTPRDCALCHRPGGLAPGKPALHVPTQAACASCHFTSAWAPNTFKHQGDQGIMRGDCTSCHNGSFVSQGAIAKPLTHIVTSASCDTCHKVTSSWSTAVYTHDAGSVGKCANCHNGTTALGKSSSHIPTGAQCDSCHTNYTSFKPAAMNHAGLAGQCSNCHGGAYLAVNAQAKPANHIPASGQCDSCHVAGFVAWTPATMNHAGLNGQCATCHGGAYVAQNAQMKPATHVSTTASCDTCHTSTTSWATRSFSHTTATPPVAGRCSSCHDSTNALGKPTNHIPTTAQCDLCHNTYTAFAPAAMNHAGTTGPATAGNCATCHGGGYTAVNAQAKPATHIPTTQSCDACHGTSVWRPTRFAHTGVAAGSCATCHNGTNALGKPVRHIPTTAACDTCHTNYAAFAPAAMNHAGTAGPLSAGNCATCHSGAYLAINAQIKPNTHITTSAQCDTCHASTSTWATGSFNHPGATPSVVGRCSTCHNGSSALGKPTTHIPTTAQCDTCHNNYAAFAPAVMSHAGTSGPAAVGNCATCHGGSYTAVNALAKPASHIPTSSQCDSCHSGYTAWMPANMNHAGLAGQCATCHSGAYLAQNAQVKPVTHIATAGQCDTCHRSTTSWATATFNHPSATPSVTGRCSTCHNGSNAIGKPTTHIPTTAQCDTCHNNYAAFTPAVMNHAGTTGPAVGGNCATCHSGAYAAINAQAKPVTHIPTSQACDTCHATSAWRPTTYAHSGVTTGSCATCHNGTNALGKPTAHIPTSAACDVCHTTYTAFAPAAMNHAGTGGPAAAGNCSTCHGGAYLAINAQVKPATHIATTAQCDTCHRSTTSWATATFNHPAATPSVVGRCSTCHNGGTAIGKPTTHIPTTAQCDTCHSGYTAFAPATMSHANTAGPAAAGNCATCHGGGYVAINALTKPASHIPTAGQCDTCHSGYTAWLPVTMNHAGLTGQCSTCHGGSYIAQNAQTKPATHISTTAQCDTCHRSTSSWATATFNHPAATPSVVGRCSTCHNGTSALGKPTNHIPTTAQCDTCHANYTAFAPATMSHANTTGPAVAGNCATCHGGSYVAVNALTKPATHIPTAGQCDTCHSGYTAWAPAAMNHSGSAGQCATCHGGGYLAQNALTKPVTHIPTSMQCDTCHHSTTSWTAATFNHMSATPPVAGICSTCHNGTNAPGKSGAHIPTTAQCDTCHNNFTAWSPATMSHAGTAGPAATGNCATCHGGAYTAINAQAKPVTHIVTSQSCDTCHGTVAWRPATYTHPGVTPGSCATCHNGTNALGKPVSHIPTTAACDTCHSNYVAFAPATMNHASTSGPLAAGNCSTCHGGGYVAINAQAKPATHVATTAQCDTCHRSTSSWATASYIHDATAPGRCSTCHNDVTALGKPATHIPTTAQCDTCHKNFASFRPAAMSHAGTTGPLAAGNCATCHGGSYVAVNALSKPATHIPTASQCDSCHGGFTNWAPATMNHAGQADCASCHGGAYVAQNAQTKPATHIATTSQCSSCHNSTTTWATGAFNHPAATPSVTGRCSTCHNGTNALGKPSNHVPTTAQCDTCHTNYTAFSPATMNHARTAGPVAAGNCSTCHSGTYTFANAQAKSATHVSTTAQCDTCHNSTTTWIGAAYTHTATAVGRCSTCHNGTNALGKPVSHIPTTAQCDTCHTNYTAFKPATMNHAGTAGACANCHNGSYVAANALAKPVSHIPTSSQCDSCHINGFIGFAPATMNHTGLAGQCSTCHGGAYLAQNAQNKPATHIATTAQCDTCHNSTTTWATGNFVHSAAVPSVTGRCSTCHTGQPYQGLGKPSTHIPTTAQCDVCHSGYTAFSPALMNHGSTSGPAAAGNCSTCHSGTYTYANAQAKSATHVATTAQCDTCHNSTTTWAGAVYTHTPSAIGQCSTCHNGTTALGKPSSHLPTAAQCDACHSGYTAFAPATMNHAATTSPAAAGNCATCHSGAYLAINAQVKPATHVATTAQCDTCHTSTTSWATATYNHDATAVGRCANCHNGATALGKPTTHIPTTAQCDVCHKNYAAFRPAAMSHAGTAGPVAVGNCSTCHGGAYTAVNALAKPSTHIPTTGQCDACHTGYTAFAPASMNHAGQTACTTCHSGAYVAQNAQTKPATHISTTAQCSTCHNSTTTWATGTFNHQAATPSVIGRCSTCHNGTNALGKPTNHVPTTAQCDVCHTNTTAFAPATMSHANTTGPVAAGNCANCHSGAYTAINAQAKNSTHIPTTQSCDICHTTSAWRPTSFAHTGVTAGTCANCHNGINAAGKPTVHIPTTQSCDVCHRTGLSWLPLITPYAHTGVVAGSCANCHASPYTSIDVKPANHLPTTAACDACHHSYSVWLPVTYNHTGVAANNCRSCHSGAYTGITAKPSNHIPTTLAGLPGDECSYCHTSKTSFTSERMNHGSIIAGCPTCHDSTTVYLVGSATKINRARHHSAGTKDCSSSGCHRPAAGGRYGTPYTAWN